MTSFGWKILPKHPFIANLASDRTADRSVNDVISMFSLHNQAEKSCFYLINLIAIQVTVNKDHLSIFSCQVCKLVMVFLKISFQGMQYYISLLL